MELYNVHNENTSNTLVGKESLFVPINVSKVQLIASMQPGKIKGKLINLPSQSIIKKPKKIKKSCDLEIMIEGSTKIVNFESIMKSVSWIYSTLLNCSNFILPKEVQAANITKPQKI